MIFSTRGLWAMNILMISSSPDGTDLEPVVAVPAPTAVGGRSESERGRSMDRCRQKSHPQVADALGAWPCCTTVGPHGSCGALERAWAARRLLVEVDDVDGFGGDGVAPDLLLVGRR